MKKHGNVCSADENITIKPSKNPKTSRDDFERGSFCGYQFRIIKGIEATAKNKPKTPRAMGRADVSHRKKAPKQILLNSITGRAGLRLSKRKLKEMAIQRITVKKALIPKDASGKKGIVAEKNKTITEIKTEVSKNLDQEGVFITDAARMIKAEIPAAMNECKDKPETKSYDCQSYKKVAVAAIKTVIQKTATGTEDEVSDK